MTSLSERLDGPLFPEVRKARLQILLALFAISLCHGHIAPEPLSASARAVSLVVS